MSYSKSASILLSGNISSAPEKFPQKTHPYSPSAWLVAGNPCTPLQDVFSKKGRGSFSTEISLLVKTGLIHSSWSIPTCRTQKHRNPLDLWHSDTQTTSFTRPQSYKPCWSFYCFSTTNNILSTSLNYTFRCRFACSTTSPAASASNRVSIVVIFTRNCYSLYFYVFLTLWCHWRHVRPT